MGPGKVRSNLGITASSVELVLPGQAHINLIKTYLKDDEIIRPAIKYGTKYKNTVTETGPVTRQGDDCEQVPCGFPSCWTQ